MRLDLNEGVSIDALRTPVQNYTIPVDTAFPIHQTVSELITLIQTKKISHQVNYFYAVDDDRKLKGVVSSRSLLFNPGNIKLNDIIDPDVIAIKESDTLEQALKVLGENQLLALPVVDQKDCLKGIFEVIPKNSDYSYKSKKIQNKASQDVFQLIGLSMEQRKWNTSLVEYRYRMPWLICNIIGGLSCAAISSFYEQTLSSMIVLAMFIPLILTLGESVAMQSMTLSLQLLHHASIRWRRVGKRLWRDIKASALIAITSALTISAAYLLLNFDKSLLFAIGASIFISMLASAGFGTLFPIILNAFSLDPKVAAGPVVLMCTDIFVTSIYLGLATWWLN